MGYNTILTGIECLAVNYPNFTPKLSSFYGFKFWHNESEFNFISKSMPQQYCRYREWGVRCLKTLSHWSVVYVKYGVLIPIIAFRQLTFLYFLRLLMVVLYAHKINLFIPKTTTWWLQYLWPTNHSVTHTFVFNNNNTQKTNKLNCNKRLVFFISLECFFSKIITQNDSESLLGRKNGLVIKISFPFEIAWWAGFELNKMMIAGVQYFNTIYCCP